MNLNYETITETIPKIKYSDLYEWYKYKTNRASSKFSNGKYISLGLRYRDSNMWFSLHIFHNDFIDDYLELNKKEMTYDEYLLIQLLRKEFPSASEVVINCTR